MQDLNSLLTGTTLLAFAATVAIAFLLPRLRQQQSSAVTRNIQPVLPQKRSVLPVEHDDPDWRECVAVSQHIADLMIADEWFEISQKITLWEAELRSTPGGERFHDIAVRTCLSGLQGLVDETPRTMLDNLAEAETEVGHFMDTYRQTPGDHVLALLAARAHMLLGDAYAADDWPSDVRRTALRRMAQHYIAAAGILAPLDPIAHMSPLLAEAHYRHALGSPGSADRLQSLFQDWIDLDPSNSDIYEQHVAALAERDLVTGEDVLREADQAMIRTENSLGMGGYALFFMPLLSEFDSARDLLDPELYAAALMDLASNSATQADVNNAAAALLTEIESAADEATAAAFRDTLILLVGKHLEVIYPRLWPISVEEIQELAAEAAGVVTEIDLPEIAPFGTTRPQSLAA